MAVLLWLWPLFLVPSHLSPSACPPPLPPPLPTGPTWKHGNSYSWHNSRPARHAFSAQKGRRCLGEHGVEGRHPWIRWGGFLGHRLGDHSRHRRGESAATRHEAHSESASRRVQTSEGPRSQHDTSHRQRPRSPIPTPVRPGSDWERKTKSDLRDWRRRKCQTKSGGLCWSAIN